MDRIDKLEYGYTVQAALPERVEITAETIDEWAAGGRLSALVLKLYREAGMVCTISAASLTEISGLVEPLSRNQAICAGLLVRISKFMVGVISLAEGTEHGEIIMALNRSIAESATNLRFLILKNDNELYDRFVATSLGTERNFYDLVITQIEKRGTLQIDNRILTSIRRVAELSGVNIQDVDSRPQDWAGSLRHRYEELDQPDRYVTEHRMGSHAVHGTWVDLLLHHLRQVGSGFAINFDWTESDGQLLSPAAYLVLDAAYAYVNSFFGDGADIQLLVERIQDLQHRILDVELSRDDWSPG